MLALTAELSHAQRNFHYTIENGKLSMQENLVCTGLSAFTFKPRWNLAFKHQRVLLVNRMATRTFRQKKQTNKQNKTKTKLQQQQQQHKQQQKWEFFHRPNFDGNTHVDNRVKTKKQANKRTRRI